MAAVAPAPAKRQRRTAGSPPASPVTQYARDVVAGRIVAGQLVRRACERHLADLDRAGLFRFDEADAARAIAIFGQLRQSKGRWAGEPLELRPWQEFVIGSIFGWKKLALAGDSGPNGRWLRRFRDAYVSVARKNGKTTIAAGVALILLDFDDEPGAEVYAAATKRDQARICWDEAARMVRKAAALKDRIKIIDSRANMHIVSTSSKFEALGADLDSTDGLNVHGSIIDELHQHKTRGLVDALENGAGAREQPLFFYITTAGLERESIYSEIDDYAKRVVSGAVEDDGWFVFIATLDADDDWRDSSLYEKANPSLGVTIRREELEAERDRALEVPGRVNSFKRFRLNQRTGQFTAWFTAEAWDACRADFNIEDLRGRTCFLGLDLASTTDVASAVLVFPDDEGDLVAPLFWIPENVGPRGNERGRELFPQWIDAGYITRTEGDLIDYDVIREDIRELSERFNIREIGFDRWNATQLITQLQHDGATCIGVGQGFASLSGPSRELEGLVAARRIRHDGNPVLRWMVLNAQKAEDPAGNIKPARNKSADKIDGLVALLMALSRRMVYDGSDGRSIYETESLFDPGADLE